MKRILLPLLFAALAPAAFAQNQNPVITSESNNVDSTAVTTIVSQNQPDAVHFFANPVTNVLQITPSAEMQNALLLVSDMRGRIVAKEVFQDLPAGQATEYQMNDLNHGIYVFVLQGANVRYSEKLMVQ